MQKSFILKPVITEKSMSLAGKSQFTFLIPKNINKLSVATVIQDRYKVEVIGVNIVKTPGKPKGKLRQVKGRTKPTVKAIVRLKQGQVIPGFQLTTENDDKEKETKKTDKNK